LRGRNGAGTAAVVTEKIRFVSFPSVRIGPIASPETLCYRWAPIHSQEEESMNWKTPKIVEIALGAEINCYACADLK